MAASPAQSGKPGTSRALDPLDLYDVRGLLTEDEQLKQADLARKAYETVTKNHDGTIEASLARQGLERLSKR